jgi:hypothetical protein
MTHDDDNDEKEVEEEDCTSIDVLKQGSFIKP